MYVLYFVQAVIVDWHDSIVTINSIKKKKFQTFGTYLTRSPRQKIVMHYI